LRELFRGENNSRAAAVLLLSENHDGFTPMQLAVVECNTAAARVLNDALAAFVRPGESLEATVRMRVYMRWRRLRLGMLIDGARGHPWAAEAEDSDHPKHAALATPETFAEPGHRGGRGRR
jgi:hypothetical protein